MKMCVKVTYNNEGTDFSIFGPFDTYKDAVRFKERMQDARRAAVKIEECVLHEPKAAGV